MLSRYSERFPLIVNIPLKIYYPSESKYYHFVSSIQFSSMKLTILVNEFGFCLKNFKTSCMLKNFDLTAKKDFFLIKSKFIFLRAFWLIKTDVQ